MCDRVTGKAVDFYEEQTKKGANLVERPIKISSVLNIQKKVKFVLFGVFLGRSDLAKVNTSRTKHQGFFFIFVPKNGLYV